MPEKLIEIIDEFEYLPVEDASKYGPAINDADVVGRRLEYGIAPELYAEMDDEAKNLFGRLMTWLHLKGQRIDYFIPQMHTLIGQFKVPGGYLLVGENSQHVWLPAGAIGRLWMESCYLTFHLITEDYEEIMYFTLDWERERFQWRANFDRERPTTGVTTELVSLVKSVYQVSDEEIAIDLITGEEYRVRWLKDGPKKVIWNFTGAAGPQKREGRPFGLMPTPVRIYRKWRPNWQTLKFAFYFLILAAFGRWAHRLRII